MMLSRVKILSGYPRVPTRHVEEVRRGRVEVGYGQLLEAYPQATVSEKSRELFGNLSFY